MKLKSYKQQLDNNNYVFLDNFISPSEAKDLHKKVLNYYEENAQLFDNDTQCPTTPSIHNFKPFLELLIKKIPNVSELIEELVLPTYTYARLYKNGDILEKHLDRPACEISLTIHLDGDHKWPIWFTKPNGQIVNCELTSGQAVLYKGMISRHWRDKFEGTQYGQVFLHYVKSQGPNWKYFFDKRYNDGS